MKRSFAVGLAVIAFAVALGSQTQSRTISLTNSASKDARYQIFFSPFARADVYLLDTQTGKIWHPVTYTNVTGDPEVWVPETRVDSQQQLNEWMATQTFKAKIDNPGTSR